MSAPASIATFSEEHAVELLARLRRAAPDAIVDAELVVALLPRRHEGSRWEPDMAARLADPAQGPAFVRTLVALADQLGRREARAAEVIAAAEAARDELTELAKRVTDHPLYFQDQADAIEELECFTDELAADLARARSLGEGDVTLVRALADQVLRLEGAQGVRLIEADMEIRRLRQLLEACRPDKPRARRAP